MDCEWDVEAGLSAEEVRRRFAWARRQGRPAWLWPDVSVESWGAALGTIQEAAVACLGGEAATDLDGGAESLGLAGYTSGMGPLLGFWIEQGRLRAGSSVVVELERQLRHNRRRAKRMEAVAAALVGRLVELGIEVLILKGAHTSTVYFPEPGVRPASDIDLLVAHGDGHRAEAVLAHLGFSLQKRSRWESSWFLPAASGEPRTLTYVHADDPWSIDLHISLNISAGRGTPLGCFDLAAPFAGRERWAVDARARVLEPAPLLLHLAAHAGVGWQNLTLLRQVELVLVVRREVASRRLCWDEFLATGRLTTALGYAYPALRLAERLLPGTVPANVLEECAGWVPRTVRRRLARLNPASAQRIGRNSLAEHFMWAQGWRGRLRMLAADLLPDDRHWSDRRRIYEARAWRLIRGTISR
ncbi:hypothetical protein HLH36_12725 [Gluconacetobacter aggeris]|uniref:Uncharacterized protein n=1 Tax=Gluconacetobacter aggeris TaxID=1286186 RepID=A0A7W4IUL8_9PROT|nr:nucleotidyltransferase family protein [Gluconacetobacter aggeris]MBB2169208.1 hypothetical protein [Gluconacetobacter aggeris]